MHVKSKIDIGSLSFLYFPSFFSTVTPGQLPTYAEEPVNELKSVVLPQFGFPARANLFIIILPLIRKQ